MSLNVNEIIKLYYRYKRKDNEDIRKYLDKIKIVRRTKLEYKTTNNIVFKELSKESVDKIREKPRNVSLTFDATELGDVVKGLTPYKEIDFLVKSSSRFFLKPDVGEIFDQMEYDDLYKAKAICLEDGYNTLPETEGEHHLMTATLFV